MQYKTHTVSSLRQLKYKLASSPNLTKTLQAECIRWLKKYAAALKFEFLVQQHREKVAAFIYYS